MEEYEYKTLFEQEGSYWWFRGLHLVVIEQIKKYAQKENLMILDAGCGTGRMMALLSDKISSTTYGFDFSKYALPFLRQQGLSRFGLGSINEIPFKDETFDVVLCIDVLESDSVDEKKALQELNRIVKKDGFVIMIVPAYRWLTTKEHHLAVHASRRYNRKQLRSYFTSENFSIKRLTHLYFLVFPLIAIYRLFLNIFLNNVKDKPRSEIRPIPRVFNFCLYQIVRFENYLLRYTDFCLGSSILAIAQKRQKL